MLIFYDNFYYYLFINKKNYILKKVKDKLFQNFKNIIILKFKSIHILINLLFIMIKYPPKTAKKFKEPLGYINLLITISILILIWFIFSTLN